MTITHNGHTYRLSEVELLEQAIRDAGGHIPKREWLQWHVDHHTPLQTVLIACGVVPEKATA